jgi:hypothetical protein
VGTSCGREQVPRFALWTGRHSEVGELSQHRSFVLAKAAITAAICLAVLASLTNEALAQRGRGFRRLFGVSRAQLASLPDVQKELKMSDEQKTRVAEVNEQLRDKRHNLLGTAFESWSTVQPRLEELNNDASNEVNQVLDPAQRKRLQEISIQQNGPRAIQDPDVATELKLSAEQQTKLAAAVTENTKAFEAGFGQGRQEQWRERMGQLADEADARLSAVLTDEQKKELDTLKGEPFEVDLPQFFRRGRVDR